MIIEDKNDAVSFASVSSPSIFVSRKRIRSPSHSSFRNVESPASKKIGTKILYSSIDKALFVVHVHSADVGNTSTHYLTISKHVLGAVAADIIKIKKIGRGKY